MTDKITADGYLADPYQNFIHLSRYSRWRDEENRRETWVETVDRYFDFMKRSLKEHQDYEIPKSQLSELRDALLNQQVGPSMRALMTAGKALAKNHVSSFNCAYIPIDSPRCFDEIMYILMCGTGVGFSVERQYVKQLPLVAESFDKTPTIIVVEDSREGWARAYRELIALLYAGHVPSWDTSKVRKAGERLKTFGGRASGPGPLEQLFAFAVNVFQIAAGRRLTTLEAHDLVCKTAAVVVAGGVRRSALISFSDLSDNRMATAKSGEWWNTAEHRRLANNSVAYTSKPDMGSFMEEWRNLYESKSGERGFFNVEAAKRQAALYGHRDPDHDFRSNPCSEILLRPYQFCNLTSVVVRETDSLGDLRDKVRLATIMGTWQSTLTNFKYLRRQWRKNTEEERLLGVSMTGQLGHPVLSGHEGLDKCAQWLEELRVVARETNAGIAQDLGIPASAAITCVKPEGTWSQLVGVSSGMHTWHSEYFLRTVRGHKTDPMSKFLADVGIPVEDDMFDPDKTDVFSFPMAAPPGALTRNDLNAIQHLELWLTWQRSWCEHKPSVTITVRDHEWMEVGAWVYKHFDELSGVSFLPHTEHIYKQAPYQDLSQQEYESYLAKMPTSIRWADMVFYESSDGTTGSQELACSSAHGCENVDLVK